MASTGRSFVDRSGVGAAAAAAAAISKSAPSSGGTVSTWLSLDAIDEPFFFFFPIAGNDFHRVFSMPEQLESVLSASWLSTSDGDASIPRRKSAMVEWSG